MIDDECLIGRGRPLRISDITGRAEIRPYFELIYVFGDSAQGGSRFLNRRTIL